MTAVRPPDQRTTEVWAACDLISPLRLLLISVTLPLPYLKTLSFDEDHSGGDASLAEGQRRVPKYPASDAAFGRAPGPNAGCMAFRFCKGLRV